MSRLGTAVPCLHNGWDIFSKTQIHGISGDKNQYDIAVHFENSTYEFRLSIRKVIRFSDVYKRQPDNSAYAHTSSSAAD